MDWMMLNYQRNVIQEYPSIAKLGRHCVVHGEVWRIY